MLIKVSTCNNNGKKKERAILWYNNLIQFSHSAPPGNNTLTNNPVLLAHENYSISLRARLYFSFLFLHYSASRPSARFHPRVEATKKRRDTELMGYVTFRSAKINVFPSKFYEVERQERRGRLICHVYYQPYSFLSFLFFFVLCHI